MSSFTTIVSTIERLNLPHLCCICQKYITLADVFAGKVGSGVRDGMPSLAHKRCIEEFKGVN